MNEKMNVNEGLRSPANSSVSNKGLDSNKKNPTKGSAFTPMPLKSDFELSSSLSGNLDSLANLLNMRCQDHITLNAEEDEDSLNAEILEKESNFSNNNNNNLSSKKNKEKTERGEPLASKMKNFLENYDNLLGMMKSNSKASSMNSASNEFYSQTYNNHPETTQSRSDYVGNCKTEFQKSRSIKFNQNSQYPKISNFAEKEDDLGYAVGEDSRGKFSSSFKSRNSMIELTKLHNNTIKSRKGSSGDTECKPVYQKRTQSDISVPQSKKSREFETTLIKMNPISPIKEEKEKTDLNKENPLITIRPLNTTDYDNDNPNEDGNENEKQTENKNNNVIVQKKASNEQTGTIMLKPIISNVKITLDSEKQKEKEKEIAHSMQFFYSLKK